MFSLTVTFNRLELLKKSFKRYKQSLVIILRLHSLVPHVIFVQSSDVLHATSRQREHTAPMRNGVAVITKMLDRISGGMTRVVARKPLSWRRRSERSATNWSSRVSINETWFASEDEISNKDMDEDRKVIASSS